MTHLFTVTNNPACVSWCTTEHGPLDSTVNDGVFTCSRTFVANEWCRVELRREVKSGIAAEPTVFVQVTREELRSEDASRFGQAIESAAELLAMDRWSTRGLGTPGRSRPISKTILIERDRVENDD